MVAEFRYGMGETEAAAAVKMEALAERQMGQWEIGRAQTQVGVGHTKGGKDCCFPDFPFSALNNK